MSDEIDAHILATLGRLEQQYTERERALEAYVDALENRLAEALGGLSLRVEEQADCLARLSKQLHDLHRQLSGR